MLVGRCLASQNRNIHPLFKILLLKSCLANIDIQVLIIHNLAMFHVNAFTKNVKIARKMIDAIRAWIHWIVLCGFQPTEMDLATHEVYTF